MQSIKFGRALTTPLEKRHLSDLFQVESQQFQVYLPTQETQTSLFMYTIFNRLILRKLGIFKIQRMR